MGSPLTTHVLDTATGAPAAGVPIVCELLKDVYVEVARGVTNADGRIADLLPEGGLHAGIWRMSFDTASYWARSGTTGFYPIVRVVFEVTDPSAHHHIPLLLSPYGYSTYRGS